MEGTLPSFAIILEKLEEGIPLSTETVHYKQRTGVQSRRPGQGSGEQTWAFPPSPSPSSLVTQDGRRECHLFNLHVSKLELREGKGLAQGDTEGW